MKKVLLSIVFFVLTVSCFSKNDTTGYFLFYGGIASPANPTYFQEEQMNGYNFGLGLGFSTSPDFSGDISISFIMFPVDNDKLLNNMRKLLESPGKIINEITFEGGQFSFVSLIANFNYNLIKDVNKIRPYLSGGAALSIGIRAKAESYVSITDTDYSETRNITATMKSASDFFAGLQVGAGIDFPISDNYRFFIDGKYLLEIPEEGDVIGCFPISLGIKITINKK